MDLDDSRKRRLNALVETLLVDNSKKTTKTGVPLLLDALANDGKPSLSKILEARPLQPESAAKLGDHLQQVSTLKPFISHICDDYASQLLDQFCDAPRLDDRARQQQIIAFRLLHDLNSHCDSIPNSYWVVEAPEIGDRWREGGEAMIRKGSYQGGAVAIRQFFAEETDWKSEEAKTILKVRGIESQHELD